MPGFLTVAEAAEFLKLSPYTIREWARTGKLPARRIGNRLRFLASDLRAAGTKVTVWVPLRRADLGKPTLVQELDRRLAERQGAGKGRY